VPGFHLRRVADKVEVVSHRGVQILIQAKDRAVGDRARNHARPSRGGLVPCLISSVTYLLWTGLTGFTG
jgi:hypothetical protein